MYSPYRKKFKKGFEKEITSKKRRGKKERKKLHQTTQFKILVLSQHGFYSFVLGFKFYFVLFFGFLKCEIEEAQAMMHYGGQFNKAINFVNFIL